MQRISSARADEIRALVTRHRAAGGSVYLLTLTLPHDEGDDLRQLRKCVARAWSKVQSGNVFQRWKKRIGIVGTVRALEVNHGPNGWHPHIHVLVLTAGKLEDTKGGMSKDAKNFETMVFRRWGSYITERDKKTKRAYRFPSREHGISFKQSHKDTYIAKMGLADELARGAWKSPRSRDGYRTPLQILRDVERRAENGVHPKGRDAKLWTEYADNMHGARQLTWSRGLRKLYDLGEEQTDLELAETEPEAIQVYEFKPEIWDNYLKNDHAAQLRVLFGAEVGGWDGVQREIDRLRGRMPVPF
jgi:hypothetical protein